MSTEPRFDILREGQVLGTWTKFEFRQKVASGEVVLWDEVAPAGGTPCYVLPPYRRTWRVFDWAEDGDALWYYVREGFIHGPRTLLELGCLVAGGYLTEEVLVATLGDDAWVPFNEVIDLTPTSEDHAGEALQHLTNGNPWGAGVEGVKALGKFFKGP